MKLLDLGKKITKTIFNIQLILFSVFMIIVMYLTYKVYHNKKNDETQEIESLSIEFIILAFLVLSLLFMPDNWKSMFGLMDLL